MTNAPGESDIVTTEIRLEKRRLRRLLRQRVLAMPPHERAAQSLQLAAWCRDLPGFAAAPTVMLYVSAFAEEIDTWPLIETVVKSGRRLILPRVAKTAATLDMVHITNTSTQLVPGCLGIPEPIENCPQVDAADLDWVLVPGLGFDDCCNRLGRGAGHYDRLLQRLSARVPRWALAFDEQCLARLPVQPHDRKVSGILTPRRVIVG